MFSDIQAIKTPTSINLRLKKKKTKKLCIGNKKSEAGKSVCLTGVMLLHLLCFMFPGGSFMYTINLAFLIPPHLDLTQSSSEEE